MRILFIWYATIRGWEVKAYTGARHNPTDSLHDPPCLPRTPFRQQPQSWVSQGLD